MLVECSICLNDITLFDKEVSVLNCGHFFHNNCLSDWLKQQMNCPECRAVVLKGNLVKNIFPKLHNETLSQWKSLKDKCGNLENEKFFLELENLSLKKG